MLNTLNEEGQYGHLVKTLKQDIEKMKEIRDNMLKYIKTIEVQSKYKNKTNVKTSLYEGADTSIKSTKQELEQFKKRHTEREQQFKDLLEEKKQCQKTEKIW